MAKDRCEICGYEDEAGSVKKYHVIPQEIMEQAGVTHTRIRKLCQNCQDELNHWYATNVSDITYDTGIQRFRNKSPQEILREYEVSFQSFTRHKRVQQKIT